MYRLKPAIAASLLAILAACGNQAGDLPAPAGPRQAEAAPVARLQLADPGLKAAMSRLDRLPQTERLSGLREPARAGLVLDSLPGALPRVAVRQSSAVTDFFQDGAPAFLTSPNAVVEGTNLVLNAPDPGVCWAVYELPALAPGAELAFLYVDSTGHNFSGRTPGMWICFANYATGKWELTARTEAFAYKRVLTKTAPYLSPAGNVYVGLIVENGQGTTIERVGVGVSRDWAQLTLLDSGDAGLQPSVALDQFASVHIAFSDAQAGNPQYALCLGTDDPLDAASWDYSFIETGSPGDARWTDLVVDFESGRPTVSYVYTGLSDPEGNSQVVLAALADHPTMGLVWANYPFHVDGASYSSLDQSLVDGAFGFACCAGNEESAPANPNDIEYRRWDLNVNWDPSDNGPVDKYTGFGEGYIYPHLRYSPAGNTAIGADGGFLLFEHAAEDWQPIYERPEAEDFGSIACMPDGISSATVMGAAYCEVQGGIEKLFYVDYDSSLIGVAEVVDSLPAAAGSFMAGTGQLAFTRAGEPVVAYTVRQGGVVSIRFAKKTAGEWKIETAVPDAGDSSDRLGIVVDLAVEPVTLFFEPTGRTVIVFNQSSGGANTLAVAVKDDLAEP